MPPGSAAVPLAAGCNAPSVQLQDRPHAPQPLSVGSHCGGAYRVWRHVRASRRYEAAVETGTTARSPASTLSDNTWPGWRGMRRFTFYVIYTMWHGLLDRLSRICSSPGLPPICYEMSNLFHAFKCSCHVLPPWRWWAGLVRQEAPGSNHWADQPSEKERGRDYYPHFAMVYHKLARSEKMPDSAKKKLLCCRACTKSL